MFRYISLQQCYEAQAAADVAAVLGRVKVLLRAAGREADAASDLGPADPDLCRRFCKNAWDLKVTLSR